MLCSQGRAGRVPMTGLESLSSVGEKLTALHARALGQALHLAADLYTHRVSDKRPGQLRTDTDRRVCMLKLAHA